MSKRLARKYKLLQQTCADLCPDCGWSMKFPDIGCIFCFYEKFIKNERHFSWFISPWLEKEK